MSKRKKVARLQRSAATATRDLWFARCERQAYARRVAELRAALKGAVR